MDTLTSHIQTQYDLCAIVGPTASGKSALAEALATAFNSAVVSIDAMQVYRGMDIGTAKEPKSLRKTPLYMVDVANVNEPYSAALFQIEARHCIDMLRAQGALPILCGGTGLYLNCVIDDMQFPQGELMSAARATYTSYLEQHGQDALYVLLQTRDPASAALIHPHNTRRIIRALELLDDNKSYATVHSGLHVRKSVYTSCIVGLNWPRAVLYERINERVLTMMQQGFVREVEQLIDVGLRESHTAAQAIGYKEVLQYLDGELSYDAMVATIQQRTRRYAKRQLSWFMHDKRVIWINCEHKTLDDLTHEALSCIQGSCAGATNA